MSKFPTVCLQLTLLSVSYYYESTRQEEHIATSPGAFSLHSKCAKPRGRESCESKKMDQGPNRGEKVSGEDVGEVESP